MNLFCLPYAGGSETAYYSWKKYLYPSIKLQPIELKGRGKRMDELCYNSINEAINDIFNNIVDKIMEDEYAIYGHSLGSLLAYELYYKVCNQKVKKPKHIFFSGQKAPSNINKEKQIRNLPDNEFMKEIMDLGGTPKELLQCKELLKLYTPIIRSDISMLERYIYKEREEKIDCDVSILSGKQDIIHTDELFAWKAHVCKEINIYNFEGDHFFINNNVKNITNIINSTIGNNNQSFYYG